MLRRLMLGGVVVAVALVGSAGWGQAQVSVSIGINLPAPPSFVIVPGTPVAYAPAVPANYFFYGSQYYVFGNGIWHVGPTYNGPWVVVAPEYIPLRARLQSESTMRRQTSADRRASLRIAALSAAASVRRTQSGQ